jgi:hypothetical protein
MPTLPDTWGLKGALLVRKPDDWLLCYVVMGSRPGSREFYMNAGIQLLCEPFGHLMLDLSLDRRETQLGKQRELPEDPELTAPVMGEVADAILAEAVPFFDRFGSLATFAAEAEIRAQATDTWRHHYRHFCALLLIGDVPGALTAGEAAERTARNDGVRSAVELADTTATIMAAARVGQAEAVQVLAEIAATSRKQLRLP